MIEPEVKTAPLPVLKSVAVTPRGMRNSSKVCTFKVCLRNEVMRSVVGEAVARERPAREGGEANFVGEFFQFRDGDSAAICGAHDRAYAGARNHANRDAFFFEDLENAYVRDAAGKASAEGDTNVGMRAASTGFDGRDNSRPKACTDRITLPKRFIGTPTFPVCRVGKPLSHNTI
jgi:hypothetical protein